MTIQTTLEKISRLFGTKVSMKKRPEIPASRLSNKPAQSSSQVDTPKWGFMVFQSQKSSGKLTQLDIPQGAKKSTSSGLSKESIRMTREALDQAQEIPVEARALASDDGVVVIKQTTEYTDVEIL